VKHGGVFEDASFSQRIAELESKTAEPGFWNDQETVDKTMALLKNLKNRYEPWKALYNEMTDLQTLFELATEAKDESESAGIESTLKSLVIRYEKQNVFELMAGEMDKNACFLTVHSGAGGTEACDWSQMLYRMYLRWAERRGFVMEEEDRLGAEGGIKSATV